MSNRFEKIIATAVVAGALALTGCNSEETEVLPFPNQTSSTGGGGGAKPGGGGGGSGSGSGGGGDNTPPVLMGRRSINATQIELEFNEPMQVGNPATAGSMFTLFRNAPDYGINWTPASITSYSPGFPWKPTNITSYNNYSNAGVAGSGVATAAVDAGDNSRIILTLNSALIETDDAATGMLRLEFANGANGVEDQAGNPAPNIPTLPANVRGNVDDGSNSPGLTEAITINANTVQLTFSEPVQIGGSGIVSQVASDFRITESAIFVKFSTVSTLASAYFANSPYRATPAPNYVYNISAAGVFITSQNRVINLTTMKPIGGGADEGRGRLRLYYTGASASPITDFDGAPKSLQPINPAPQHPGNVIDTIP